MASKQGCGANLKNYINKRLQMKLNGKREIIGRLKGYDPYMNVVLDEVFEVKRAKNNGEKDALESIGSCLVRGNSITMWECLDKIEDNNDKNILSNIILQK